MTEPVSHPEVEESSHGAQEEVGEITGGAQAEVDVVAGVGVGPEDVEEGNGILEVSHSLRTMITVVMKMVILTWKLAQEDHDSKCSGVAYTVKDME